MSILPIACFSTLSTGIVRLSTAQPVSILKQHRHIMSNSEERNNAEYRYAPYRKHPELFGDTFPDEWLHSDMHQIAKALKNATTIDSCVDPKALTPFLHEEGSQIYSFNCLSPIFLQLLNEELVNFYQMSEKYEIPVRRPNSSKNNRNRKACL